MDLSIAPRTSPAERIRPCEAKSVRLPFRVGAHTLWSVRRELVRFTLSLEQSCAIPDLPTLPRSADGYLVTGLRQDLEPVLTAAHPQLRLFVRNRYARHYASLQGGFDAYLSGFSAKSRSTLKRKCRKLAERSGGAVDVRCYSRSSEVDEFHRLARAVSATTYQEKLLGAGLPDGNAARENIRTLAARGDMRGWLLFLDGRPISYLYAPAEGDTLIYAHLGYDPAYADLSPGTVLQFEAMRSLMSESRFRVFDFTEGEGQHKRQFATGAVDCVDLLLLRPTLANLAIAYSLSAFDAAVAAAKPAVAALGLSKLARAPRG